MAEVYLGLGTNLGHKEENIQIAIELIKEQIGQLIDLSALYTSKPWGFSSSNDFINAVAKVETSLSPENLLHQTQQIEMKIGRSDKSIDNSYKDRLIDIDILLYDRAVIKSKELCIPHPYINEREFVLIPLLELSPNLIDPISGEQYSKSIKDKHTLHKLNNKA